MKSKTRRFATLLSASLLVAAGVVTAPALATSASAANTFHPSGCTDYFINSWSSSCWQGQYYVNQAVSVYAIQYVLEDLKFSPGAIDCQYGPNTDKAMIRFQQFHGLTADGIAGPSTLGHMQSHLVNSGVSDVNGTYYNVGSDGVRFWKQDKSPTVFRDYWYVLMHTSKQHGYVAMGAGYTGFCV